MMRFKSLISFGFFICVDDAFVSNPHRTDDGQKGVHPSACRGSSGAAGSPSQNRSARVVLPRGVTQVRLTPRLCQRCLLGPAHAFPDLLPGLMDLNCEKQSAGKKSKTDVKFGKKRTSNNNLGKTVFFFRLWFCLKHKYKKKYKRVKKYKQKCKQRE